jgi:hypothetical protein
MLGFLQNFNGAELFPRRTVIVSYFSYIYLRLAGWQNKSFGKICGNMENGIMRLFSIFPQIIFCRDFYSSPRVNDHSKM